MSEVQVESEGSGVIAPPSTGSLANEIRTIPLNLLIFMRNFTRAADRVYYVMGWICGMELLLLGFFITYQVIARKVGWVQAPATDVMSGYILAMAATWSFSYSYVVVGRFSETRLSLHNDNIQLGANIRMLQ